MDGELEDLAGGLAGVGVELGHLPAHRPGLGEVPAAHLGLAVERQRDDGAVAARDLLGAGSLDLVAPLEERGIGDEALGENDVGGLGRAEQLVRRLVVSALLVLEDLGLALQPAALAERARADAVELDTKETDCVAIFAKPS